MINLAAVAERSLNICLHQKNCELYKKSVKSFCNVSVYQKALRSSLITVVDVIRAIKQWRSSGLESMTNSEQSHK